MNDTPKQLLPVVQAAQSSDRPEAAERAAESLGTFGLILLATEWHVEAMVRRTRDDAAAVAAARGHGLLHLTQHLQMYVTLITRFALRAPNVSQLELWVRGLERVCGGKSRASEQLLATAPSGSIPRAAVAGVVAQCILAQDAFGALVSGGASPGLGRAGFTPLHYVALLGDAALARAAVAALPADEAARQLRAATAGDGQTPAQLALRGGFAQCAAELGRLDAAGRGDGSPLPEDHEEPEGREERPAAVVDAEEGACAAENIDDGGWGRGGVQAGGAAAACEVDVVAAPLGAAQFARLAARERPFLVRNGSAVAERKWAALRRAFAHEALVAAHGALRVKVSAVPYHDGSQPREVSLAAFAASVAAGRSGDAYLFESLPPRHPVRAAAAAHLPRAVHELVGEAGAAQQRVQLALGGAGSGAPWHYHKAAASTLVYGRKRWWLRRRPATSLSPDPNPTATLTLTQVARAAPRRRLLEGSGRAVGARGRARGAPRRGPRSWLKNQLVRWLLEADPKAWTCRFPTSRPRHARMRATRRRRALGPGLLGPFCAEPGAVGGDRL